MNYDLFDYQNKASFESKSSVKGSKSVVTMSTDLVFPFIYKELRAEIESETNKKLVFYDAHGDVVQEYDILKGEHPLDAIKRVHKQLTNSSPDSPSSPLPEHENKIIKLDEKEIKKIKDNFKNGKIVLNIFCRGAFVTGKMRTTDKTYKKFNENGGSIQFENAFYKIKQKGYIIATQHKKTILAMLKTKKIETDGAGRIVIRTTTRALAVQSGASTSETYGKKAKEYVIKLLEELKLSLISITNKTTNEEVIFSYIDNIYRNNENFVIVLNDVFSQMLYREHLIFLPENLDFKLPPMLFDVVLYFESQVTNKNKKIRIHFKTMLQILHVYNKQNLYKFKQILKEHETKLKEEYHIFVDFENKILDLDKSIPTPQPQLIQQEQIQIQNQAQEQ